MKPCRSPFSIALMAASVAAASASAQSPDRVELARNVAMNAAEDFVTCTAYFVLASEGVANSGDAELSANLEHYAALSMAYGLQMSGLAGQLPEAFEASYQLTRRTMLRRIDNHFSNMAILSNDYMELCEESLRDPAARMQYWRERLSSQ